MSARGRSPLMEKLLALGEPEIKQGWLDCAELEIGPEHIEELIGLALDESLNSAPSDSQEVWVPVHAWRALAQLHAAAAAEPLTHLLERIYEDDDDWVGEEMPRVFGMIGPPAISPLSEYLRANDHSVYARVAAVEGLQCIGSDHPEVRDEVVAVLSDQLAASLKTLLTKRKKEALKDGLGEPAKFIFQRDDKPMEQNYIRRVYKKILIKAGIREMRIHDIRHTFASLLLSKGESPVYVKEQLGHSSIKMTVDVYGHLIPGSNRGAVNQLDSPQPSATCQNRKVVTPKDYDHF